MNLRTADLVDEHEATLRCCNVQFRQFGGVARFSGPVRTIRCFEDNPLIKQALSTPGEGAVLVVDMGLASVYAFFAGLACNHIDEFAIEW